MIVAEFLSLAPVVLATTQNLKVLVKYLQKHGDYVFVTGGFMIIVRPPARKRRGAGPGLVFRVINTHPYYDLAEEEFGEDESQGDHVP